MTDVTDVNLEFDAIQKSLWRLDAACRGLDPEVFYPASGDMEGLNRALAVCENCPVRQECLEENITEKLGVFGGTSGAERKRLKAEWEIILSCKLCSKDYVRETPSQVFCSEECRREARRNSRRKYDASR